MTCQRHCPIKWKPERGGKSELTDRRLDQMEGGGIVGAVGCREMSVYLFDNGL